MTSHVKRFRLPGLIIAGGVALLALLALWPGLIRGETVTKAVLSPSDSTLAPTASATLDVIVNDVTGQGLGAYDITLTFNPAVVNVTSVGGGDSPFDGGPISNINNTAGTVAFAAFQSSIPGPLGNVRIAEITFEAVGASGDNTALTFTAVDITDAFGDPIGDNGTAGSIDVFEAVACGFTFADSVDGGDIEAGNAIQFTDISESASAWAWDFGGLGTDTVQNPTFTFTAAGTHTVGLTVDGTEVCSEEVEVVAGDIATVSIDPASANLDVEGTTTFAVTAADAHGNPITQAEIEADASSTLAWSVVDGDAGSIGSDTGIFTAGTLAGTFTGAVQADASYKGGNAADTASVVVEPGPIVTLAIQETSANVEVEGTLTFTVQGEDQYGNAVSQAAIEAEQTTLTWSVDDSDAGSIGASTGVFTAGQLADLFIETIQANASYKGGSAQDAVDVTVDPGPLDDVVVTAEVVDAYQPTAQFQLSARGFDVFDNEIPDLIFGWDLDPAAKDNNGSIDTNGGVTAPDLVGDYTASATASKQSGPITGTYDFTVVPGPLDSIVVLTDPKGEATATLAVTDPAQTQQFVATGYDEFLNEIGNTAELAAITVEWDVTDSDAGSIDTSGLFTAGTVLGTYANVVTATIESVVGSASVEIIEGVSIEFLAEYQMEQLGQPLPLEVKLIDTSSGEVITEIVTPVAPLAEGLSLGKSFTFIVVAPPGTYDVTVKGPNTLRNSELAVDVTPGMGPVDIGILVLGDFWGSEDQGDNVINTLDYLALLALFSTFAGDDGEFLDTADLNRDGVINILDYSGLIANFGEFGDIDPSIQPLLPAVIQRGVL